MSTYRVRAKEPFWKNWNYFTGLVTSLLMALGAYGITIPPEMPQQIFDAITTKNWAMLATLGIALFNIIRSAIKRNKEKNLPQVNGFSSYSQMAKEKPFWKSWNFWAGIFSTAVLTLAYFGIDIPQDTPQRIWDAVESKNWTILIGILVNVFNIFYHRFIK